MNNPTFQNKGNKYIFTWPLYKLDAEVSRIYMNHERTVCHVLFTSSHEESNPHILQTRFNLESARSRSELAKDLALRYKIKEPIDWKNLLEYISIKSLREYQKGESVVEITSNDDIKPLEYLIDPIAPLNKPTVIFGDPGSGKSQLCIILNIIIALPWIDNPLKLTAPTEPIVALFCDYEADDDDIRRQVKAFTDGMDLGFVTLHYRRCTLPIADDIEAIMNHAEAVKARCLFIDSTSLAAGDDLNKMNVATAYFRALRQLNMTSISLAHTSKDRESKNKSIIGSVLWEAGARSVWECRGQEDEDTLDIALFHRKANLNKKSPTLGFRITYNNEGNTISWYNPKSVPEFVERMSNTQRILELLKEEPLTMKDITENLDISYQATNTTIKRLAGKKLVTQLSDKKWGLMAKESY